MKTNFSKGIELVRCQEFGMPIGKIRPRAEKEFCGLVLRAREML
jgi:hypothetical protein